MNISAPILISSFCGLIILAMGLLSALLEREKKPKWLSWVSALAGCIIIFAAILQKCEDDKNMQKIVELTLLSGPITPGRAPDPTHYFQIPENAVTIYLGSSSASITNLHECRIIQFGDIPILLLRKSDQGLHVYLKIFSADGRIIAEIDNNHFQINRNNYFKIDRINQHQLAVYNQFAKKVLSVHYLNPKSIEIEGEFFAPNYPKVVITKDEIYSDGGKLSQSHFQDCQNIYSF